MRKEFYLLPFQSMHYTVSCIIDCNNYLRASDIRKQLAIANSSQNLLEMVTSI